MFYVATNSKGLAIKFEDTKLNAVKDTLQREFSNADDFEIEEFESEQEYLRAIACRDGFWG